MEITTEALPWDSEDIVSWKSFLNTKAGQRLIPKLLESTPELSPGGDTNSILIRHGEVRGFQEIVRAMLFLASHPPVVVSEPASSYPSLVDDAKWDDGQKIQP